MNIQSSQSGDEGKPGDESPPCAPPPCDPKVAYATQSPSHVPGPIWMVAREVRDGRKLLQELDARLARAELLLEVLLGCPPPPCPPERDRK